MTDNSIIFCDFKHLRFLCLGAGKLGLDWLCIGLNWVWIGFVLGLFFGGIMIFGSKQAKIGFVLHKKGWICRGFSTGVEGILSCVEPPTGKQVSTNRG